MAAAAAAAAGFRVGAIGQQPSRMTQHAPRIAAVARQAKLDPQRSPLFHWLAKHHDRLVRELTGKRINWAPLIAAAIRAGIKDGLGRDPIERTVRRTWKDVRAVHEARASLPPKPPRKLQPRDLPADWKPTPIPAPALAAPVPAGQPSTALPPLTHPSQTRVVGQSSFGVVTSGPLTPEPDYTGMDVAERKIARAKWHIALRQPG